MPTYTITQLKNHMGHILDTLQLGGEVTITRWGKPVAKLTALADYAEPKPKTRSLRGILATPDTPDLSLDELQGQIREIRDGWKDRLSFVS